MCFSKPSFRNCPGMRWISVLSRDLGCFARGCKVGFLRMEMRHEDGGDPKFVDGGVRIPTGCEAVFGGRAGNKNPPRKTSSAQRRTERFGIRPRGRNLLRWSRE